MGGGREVGRTAILVALDNRDDAILFDYGISFDEQDRPVFPLSVSPIKLKAIFVSHAHLDHIGATPLLYVSAKPSIITTRLTLITGKIMIEDMLRLSGYYVPYEYPELISMMDSARATGIRSTIDIDNVQIDIYNAGHIPGSCMFRIHTKNKTILYTGDINTIDTKLVRGADVSGISANILIMESTYAQYNHPPRNRVEENFIEVLKMVLNDGGTILIPSFSLGRAQEILAILADKMPHANVYYDGMARDIMMIYLENSEYINRIDLLRKAYELFNAVKDSRMRKKICNEPGNIIVAPAGMLKGGPATYYIKKISTNSRNAIVLVSFQAPTTPGKKLLTDGILTEDEQLVKAKVFWFDLSSHAGSNDLFNIVKSIKGIEKLILVHGAEESMYSFGHRVKEELGIDFSAPVNGETIKL